MKSPEWRWQWRIADLRQFEISRHGPIIIYTRLPAGGTCYPICTFPASSECLIGISDTFSVFVYGYPPSSPRAHCTPNKNVPTQRYTRRHGPIYTQVHARRLLPSAVPWISEDRLFILTRVQSLVWQGQGFFLFYSLLWTESPCYRSSTQKFPVFLPKVQVADYS